ncbi:hypothetical protein [Macrococcus bovicus]|uniref:PglD N-terminal domain-containing protein n=1 Tax=Macrococcus bovicus TaxID=69968 RepID=A0A4V3BFM6_9STAP|nr:hypothetical protein [Macrococcus bovicus]TDM14922.1 hypothetical protein ERX55_03000 [Macrococcus bovicus]
MNIVIIGRGGFSYVVEEELSKLGSYNVVGYMDASIEVSHIKENRYYLKMFDLDYIKDDIYYFIAIGNIEVRRKIVEQLNIPSNRFITIISRDAYVSSSVEIGNGSYIGPGTIINANTIIGSHTTINTRVTIEHNSKIGDFCLINTSSTLYSHTTIESNSVVKVGSVIVVRQPE